MQTPNLFDKQKILFIVASSAIVVAITMFLIVYFFNKKNRELSVEKDKALVESSLYKDENTALTDKAKKLSKDYQSLNKKYKALMDSSLSRNQQLNLVLYARTEELNEKESKIRELQRLFNKQDSILKVLNKALLRAMVGFSAEELKIQIKNGKIYVSLMDKLLFKTGSATIESKGNEALKKLAQVLGKNKEFDILVEGHTDNVPIKNKLYRDNWDLSVARATALVRILNLEYKISASRLSASGRADFQPVSSNNTNEGKAMNRRTEIILIPYFDELYRLIQLSRK